MNNEIKSKLVKAGVKNLRQFGYPSANDKNIITDAVYSAFFLSMLQDNKGKGYDKEINSLIEEIEGAQQ